MSNTNRGPFYTHEQLTEVADFGAGELEYVLSRTQLVRDYEAARAKDAELIQYAVDEFHHLLMMRQDEVRAMKPAPPPNIIEMLLTQSAPAKFYSFFLDKAEAAGFKPSDQ